MSAIYAVLGRQTAKEMLPVDGKWEQIRVSGYVSKPTASRGNRSGQLFFVNGRHVKSRAMTAALEEAYRNQIMVGRFPTCVLNVELPLHTVDVNVHPTKTEVRFLSEKQVFDSIHYGVLSVLNKASGKKDVVFPKQPTAAPVEKPAKPVVKQTPKQETFRQMSAGDYKALAAAMGKPVTPSKTAAETLLKKPPMPQTQPATAKPTVLHSEVRIPQPKQTETPAPVYTPVSVRPKPEPKRNTEPKPVPQSIPKPDPDIPEEAPAEQETIPLQEAPKWRVVGEVMDSYIIVEEAGAVLFIDKHAAHERILFEKLKKQETRAMSQVLLTPIPAELSREDSAILLENQDLLLECGYELEDFGDHRVLVRAIPDDIDIGDAEATLAVMASDLQHGRRADPDSLRDELLHTIACKAAIKAGWHTEPAERDALVREVMTRDDLKYCPHGRPICIRMTEGSLRRQFKRS